MTRGQAIENTLSGLPAQELEVLRQAATSAGSTLGEWISTQWKANPASSAESVRIRIERTLAYDHDGLTASTECRHVIIDVPPNRVDEPWGCTFVGGGKYLLDGPAGGQLARAIMALRAPAV